MLIVCIVFFYKKLILLMACLYCCYLGFNFKIKNLVNLKKQAKLKESKNTSAIASFIFILLIIPGYVIVIFTTSLYIASMFRFVIQTVAAKWQNQYRVLYQNKIPSQELITQLNAQLSNVRHKKPIVNLTTLLKLCYLDIKNYGPYLFVVFTLLKKQPKKHLYLFKSYGKSCLCIVLTGYPLWYLLFLKKISLEAATCLEQRAWYKRKLRVKAIACIRITINTLFNNLICRVWEKQEKLQQINLVHENGELRIQLQPL